MFAQQHRSISALALLAISALGLVRGVSAVDDSDARPQYTYGHEIPVTCLERNMFVPFHHHLPFSSTASSAFPALLLCCPFPALHSATAVANAPPEKPASTSKTTRAASNTSPSPSATRPASPSPYTTALKQTSTAPYPACPTPSTISSSSTYTTMRP